MCATNPNAHFMAYRIRKANGKRNREEKKKKIKRINKKKKKGRLFLPVTTFNFSASTK